MCHHRLGPERAFRHFGQEPGCVILVQVTNEIYLGLRRLASWDVHEKSQIQEGEVRLGRCETLPLPCVNLVLVNVIVETPSYIHLDCIYPTDVFDWVIAVFPVKFEQLRRVYIRTEQHVSKVNFVTRVVNHGSAMFASELCPCVRVFRESRCTQILQRVNFVASQDLRRAPSQRVRRPRISVIESILLELSMFSTISMSISRNGCANIGVR